MLKGLCGLGLQALASSSRAFTAAWTSSNITQAVSSTAPEESVVDCIVVGAGVVGLACARAAAQAGLEVVVLEQEPKFGNATSSRHSEVIHAGIYYPAGSLKAHLCVEGKHMLYKYCDQKDIPHAMIGKLIVASTEQQVPKLKQLQQFAAANGVHDLQLLSGGEAEALEPALQAAAALLSPSTGILDSHSYMASLLADAEAAGAVLATHSKAQGVQPGASRISSGSSTAAKRLLRVDVKDVTSGEISRLQTRWLINAAGLHAQALPVVGLASSAVPKQHLAKGNYFSLAHKAPFHRLIYPLPEDGGLGVHLTLDLAGQAKFGPDVEWVDRVDYTVDPSRAAAFYPAIRTYYPGLPDDSLQPSYCGIRPKISGPGQPAADFLLQGEAQHGVQGLVNLFGIESPGLTSSLAIGQAVIGMMT